MDSMSWVFTHDYPNDTMVTFTPDKERSELELSFDHEDPDVGRELLYYGGDGTLVDMVRDLYEELFIVNDKLDAGVELSHEEEIVYGDYTLNALAAFENALRFLLESVLI